MLELGLNRTTLSLHFSGTSFKIVKLFGHYNSDLDNHLGPCHHISKSASRSGLVSLEIISIGFSVEFTPLQLFLSVKRWILATRFVTKVFQLFDSPAIQEIVIIKTEQWSGTKIWLIIYKIELFVTRCCLMFKNQCLKKMLAIRDLNFCLIFVKEW